MVKLYFRLIQQNKCALIYVVIVLQINSKASPKFALVAGANLGLALLCIFKISLKICHKYTIKLHKSTNTDSIIRNTVLKII